MSSPESIKVLKILIDSFWSFAAMASVSLKTELEMEAGTNVSIMRFVIILPGSDAAAEINLSISFESCQRFDPTCAARKLASDGLICPFRAAISSIIHFVTFVGSSGGNSSTVPSF